ncbi:MAG: hypothetical protein B5M54_04415 [Candidatus Aminicenantes bacterium 4484_214]|nr:MAG: hypothetical protein B5M54_04415 [Candidatus Aminicenantes bacterium 4484_214]
MFKLAPRVFLALPGQKKIKDNKYLEPESRESTGQEAVLTKVLSVQEREDCLDQELFLFFGTKFKGKQ